MNKECLFSSKTDLWETPKELYERLNSVHHFDIDVCATPENAKCPVFFYERTKRIRTKVGGKLLVQSALWPRNR